MTIRTIIAASALLTGLYVGSAGAAFAPDAAATIGNAGSGTVVASGGDDDGRRHDRHDDHRGRGRGRDDHGRNHG